MFSSPRGVAGPIKMLYGAPIAEVRLDLGRTFLIPTRSGLKMMATQEKENCGKEIILRLRAVSNAVSLSPEVTLTGATILHDLLEASLGQKLVDSDIGALDLRVIAGLTYSYMKLADH